MHLVIVVLTARTLFYALTQQSLDLKRVCVSIAKQYQFEQGTCVIPRTELSFFDDFLRQSFL